MFIIQQNLINQLHLEKIKNVVDGKYPVKYIDLKPFSEETIPDINELNKLSGIAIPYGSSNLTKLAYKNKWEGCYYDQNFNYKTYCENRSDMFNSSDLSFDVKTMIYILQATSEEENNKKEWFIKPVEDNKIFTGYCDTLQNILEWLKDIANNQDCEGSYYFPLDTKLMLCPKRPIHKEYRFFVINKKVITGSTYIIEGQIIQNPVSWKELKIAQRFADHWLPHRNCVMDICICNDNPYILEFNCINSSGFYSGHGIDLVFKELYNDFKLFNKP